MKIYELDSNVERFVWIRTPIESQLEYGLEHFKGLPMKGHWHPLKVEHLIQSKADKRLTVGDFPNWGDAPVFSRKAVEPLRDLLEPNGEILPFKSKDGEYYAFNVTNVVDALDEGKSEIDYYPDGGVSEIMQYVFCEDLVRNEVIFKIPQMKKMVYITDTFIQRVRDEELLGFKFPEVYPHTEDQWAFLKKPAK